MVDTMAVVPLEEERGEPKKEKKRGDGSGQAT